MVITCVDRKVDVRLPGRGNSNSHGARPVNLIITMILQVRVAENAAGFAMTLGENLWFRDAFAREIEPGDLNPEP